MESYTPVSYEFRDVLQDQIQKGTNGKVFFWNKDEQVDECIGKIEHVDDRGGNGLFAVFGNGDSIRIDRIITLFGKPGPGYDAYDAFANQCLACTAGVPL
ncbi:hypothetical protein WBG78_17210 [Chryseolinea sp. T2]|uniref:hypothetical protein n=1 Tax=Chryseolinea sp. T2 TaxID=3129255 RepID=UPI003076A901